MDLNKQAFLFILFILFLKNLLVFVLLSDTVIGMNSILNEILSNPCGSVTFDQLPLLAKAHPSLILGVKMGLSTRFTIDAARAEMVISNRVANGDYVREVFIPSETYRSLRKNLGFE